MTPPTLAAPMDRPVRLLITSHASWARLRALGEWAFADPARSKAEEFEEGDLAVVYLTQGGGDSSLGGLVRVDGPLRRVHPRTLFDKLYPNRMRIAVLKAPDPPVPFRPLVGRMRFIENKQNWGLYLQGHPIRKLSPEDARTILDALEGV